MSQLLFRPLRRLQIVECKPGRARWWSSQWMFSRDAAAEICENTRLENGQRRNVKLGAYFSGEIRISAMVPDSLSESERSSETYSFDFD
ncbi:hypothetical protein CASFOL_020797 [Castilleja foliolosa]|uniref:Uncharacterized protein n=1 Tax=Castilleja foliolosa TaxID=1961234 RepID=A0ABD3D5N5_9LAMI